MSQIVLQNPITDSIKMVVQECSKSINFAVPFISSFALKILPNEKVKNIPDKKIITRFDDSFINSFDLPVLKKLLEAGFEIRFDNDIHLKLYITDNNAYVSSSNLTKSGFEDNIELTVQVDEKNINNCKSIFNDIWNRCHDNKITLQTIEDNWSVYQFIKKRDSNYKKDSNKTVTKKAPNIGVEIQKIIDIIFNQNKDYSQVLDLEFKASKIREIRKKTLIKGFNSKMFYLAKGDQERKHTIHYDLLYGYECKLANTGLRDSHFESFTSSLDLENVINFIFPEVIGMKPWNFEDPNIQKQFCNGLFDFNIPSYKEAIPIRLASYFYPNVFLPIFKLDQLQEICKSFGFETSSKSKGERLFLYNSFLKSMMKSLPYENIVKAHIAYQVKYTVELLNRLNLKENYDSIITNSKKKWIKNYFIEANEILNELQKD